MHDEAIGSKTSLESREKELKKQSNDCAVVLAQMGNVDTDNFESQHPDLLNVALEKLNGKRDLLQHEIDSALQEQRETKNCKNSDLKAYIYSFKNPVEEITRKYRDWRSDVSRLPETVEFMGEYQAYYQRLLDEDLPGLNRASISIYRRISSTKSVHSMCFSRIGVSLSLRPSTN